eukprot:scaffold71048_cov55-Attheya_sp.AAC.1
MWKYFTLESANLSQISPVTATMMDCFLTLGSWSTMSCVLCSFGILVLSIVLFRSRHDPTIKRGVDGKSGSLDAVRGHVLKPIRRAMTSIGRFAIKSQDADCPPHVITVFIATAVKRGMPEMTVEEFEKLWENRVVSKHERFRSRVCADNNKYFE